MATEDLSEQVESPKKAVSLICMDSTNLWLSVNELLLFRSGVHAEQKNCNLQEGYEMGNVIPFFPTSFLHACACALLLGGAALWGANRYHSCMALF